MLPYNSEGGAPMQTRAALVAVGLVAMMWFGQQEGCADVRLTLVNMAEGPIGPTPLAIELPQADTLGPGPIGARADGQPVACQVEEIDGRKLLWLNVSLAARQRKEVVVGGGPPVLKSVAAQWDQGRRKGQLDNGLLSVEVDGEEIRCRLADGRVAFSNLHFYGWLTDTAESPASPAVAAQWKLPRLSTREFAEMAGKVLERGPVRSGVELLKRAAGGAAGVVYRERLWLYGGRGRFDYELTIRNETGRRVYITQCDGIIHGRWGDGLAAAKTLYYPQGGRLTLTREWFSIWARRIRAREKLWAAVVTERGPSFGVIRLEGGVLSWAFTSEAFWLYQADPSGAMPIKLDDGQQVTWRLGFLVLDAEGEKAAEQVRAAFLRARGTWVSVYRDGRPLVYSTIGGLSEDFRQSQRWLVSGGRLEPTPRGARLSAAPGAPQAAAYCALSMRVSEMTALAVEVAEMAPGARLEVSAQARDGQTITLAELTGPGRREVRWPRIDQWRGRREFVLRMAVRGKNAWAVVKSLQLVAKLSRAALLSPMQGQDITDVAAFLQWKSVPDADHYEVELSRRADFTAPQRLVAPEISARVAVWVPEQPLAPGKWYWRVRAVGDDGQPGAWSEPRWFSVNNKHPVVSPRKAPSPKRPFFILHAPSEIAKAWQIVPDDLRPYCALRVEVAERQLDFQQFCREAEENGVNVVIQCSGPGGGVYSEVYGDRYGRQSLALLEWAFQNCPHVVAGLICEQNFHMLGDPTSAEYFRRLAVLCAKYGRLLIFADGHWGKYTWLEIGNRPELLEVFRRYPEHVVPLWKMNCGQVPLTIHGAVLGLWVAGVTKQFGVEPEDWYWYEAGFRGLGEGPSQFKTGRREMCPPTFWAQMILTGLASGATCYCLEPCWGMWDARDTAKPTPTWTRVVKPLLRAIVHRGLIPARKAVLSRIKIAVQTGEDDLQFSRDFGAFRVMYQTLYGLQHPAELIPDSSRYYFVPLLGPLLRDAQLPAGIKRVEAKELQKEEGVRAVFDPAYPAEAKGDAFAVRVGDVMVAMNCQENKDVQQSFSLPLNVAGIRRIGGRLGPHGFVVGKVEGKQVWLQVNGRKDRTARLILRADRAPRVDCRPQQAVDVKWLGDKQAALLTVSHHQGAVEIVLGAR